MNESDRKGTPMHLKKLFITAAVAASLVFALAACSETENGQGETSASGEQASDSGGQTMMEAQEETTMAEATEEMVGEGEVTVGGFVVESPGVPERSIPEVETSREDVNEYLGQIQPIIDGTVRDITSLVEPEVQVGEDGVSLDLNLSSLNEARQSVEEGAAGLREIQPPEGLEPINDQLIELYEDALPAYQNISEAAENGSPEEFASVVDESLPQIQAFNNEVNQILQDLERAAGEEAS